MSVLHQRIFALCLDPCSEFDLRDYVKRNPTCVDYESLLGSSPLHFIALSGNIKIAAFFLEHGADVDFLNFADETPLHWAAKAGDVEMVKFLLQNGADIDSADQTLCTPLHWAVEAGNIDVVDCLLANGALITLNDNDETPLRIAEHNGDLLLFKRIIAHC